MENYAFLKEILERLGFPIVVSLWLLFRTDKKLDKIIEINQELVTALLKKKE